MPNDNGVRMRFRPAGAARRKPAVQDYSPLGTGCPVVEQAVEALYQAQNEEGFWMLMNALNYALQLETRVLVPLSAAPVQPDGAAPWAEYPVPAEKAADLPLWTLRTQKGRNYLPVFTSVRTAEADKNTALRPMAELPLAEAMQRVLDNDTIDGVVIDPWTHSATLECSLLNGLLHAPRDAEEPGEAELEAAAEAARAQRWDEAASLYEDAAGLGRAEGLTFLGSLLYEGHLGRPSPAQARRLWKKAADADDVLALVALGDDCIARGHTAGEALQYYRRAQKASRATPDITYLPQVQLRLAQYETRYTSRSAALAQLAQARQGFSIRLREGDEDARLWLEETEAVLRSLSDAPTR